jgi:hypothetical protein
MFECDKPIRARSGDLSRTGQTAPAPGDGSRRPDFRTGKDTTSTRREGRVRDHGVKDGTVMILWVGLGADRLDGVHLLDGAGVVAGGDPDFGEDVGPM